MGSSTDYSKVIAQQVGQANLPKAPISQEYSNLYGSAAPDIMRALLNVQSLGNSYINTPGNNKSTYVPTNPSPVGGFGYTVAPSASNPTGVAGGSGTAGGNGAGGANAGGTGNANFNISPYSFGAAANPNASVAPAAAPTVNGYSGGFTSVYGDKLKAAGLDPSTLAGNATFGSLLSSGKLTSDQVQSILGSTYSTDPANDPDVQSQYNNWVKNQPANASFGSAGPPSITDWYSQFGPLGANVNAYSPNDVTSFQSALSALPKDVNSPSGSPYYLQNGQFTDANGNVLGSSGGSTGTPGASSNNTGSGVNISDNGLPGGVNVPGVSTAFGGDPSGGMASLLQALGLSSNILGGQQALTNPQNLNQAGATAASGLGQGANLTNPINSLLGNANGNPLGLSPQTNDTFSAITKLADQQLQKTQADTRESALQQGTSRSTGESYAEAQNNAASIPSLVAALSQAGNAATSNQLQAGSNNTSLLNTLLGSQNTQLGQQANNLFSGENAVQGIQNTVNTGNSNNLQGNQSLNALLAQLGLGNSSQTNTYNTAIGAENQQAAQGTINQQISILQQLLGGGLNLAGSGIPGSSVNTSLSPNSSSGNGLGGDLSGIGSILGGLSGLMAAFG